MNPDEPKPNKPPYLSFVTLANFLKDFTESDIPDEINKSIMPTYSGATQSYLLTSMSFLGLTDTKGKPTKDLVSLVKSGVTGDGAKEEWRKLFERAYRPIIGEMDLTTATPSQLLEKFKAFEYGGDTLRKCHVFFLNIAEAAALPVGKHLKVVGKIAAVRKGPKKVKPDAPDDGNGNGGSKEGTEESLFPALEGHSFAELPLKGDRFVRLQAPTTITTAELARITSWLSFQLIVEDSE